MKCPKCGSSSISTTLMGCIGLDYNRVRCGHCKEVGIAWHWQSDEEINKYLDSQKKRGFLRGDGVLEKVDELRWIKATGGDLSHDLP